MKDYSYLTSETVILEEIEKLREKSGSIHKRIVTLRSERSYWYPIKVEGWWWSDHREYTKRESERNENRRISLDAQLTELSNKFIEIGDEIHFLEEKLTKLMVVNGAEDKNSDSDVRNSFSFGVFFKKVSISVLAGIVGAIILNVLGLTQSEIFSVSAGGIITISVYIISSNFS